MKCWLGISRNVNSRGGNSPTLSSVRYAADRTDPDVHFTDDALEMLLNVPRIFLPTVLKGCVAWAKEHGVTEVTAVEMKIINDKRAKEKGKG